jgi:hypothetical protein
MSITPINNIYTEIKILEKQGLDYKLKSEFFINKVPCEILTSFPEINQIHLLLISFTQLYSVCLKTLQNVQNICLENHELAENSNLKLTKALLLINELKEQNFHLKQMLQEAQLLEKQKEELKQQKKLKRLNRQKKPLRDTIDNEQFFSILNEVKGENSLIIAHDKIGLLLLKLFGW